MEDRESRSTSGGTSNQDRAPQSSILDPQSSRPVESAASPNAATHEFSLYGLEFWTAYVANLLLVTANTLLFRFSDFVAYLNANADAASQLDRVGAAITDGKSAAERAAPIVGYIFGIAAGVSVIVRVWLGRAIDRHGPRWIWMGSAATLVASVLACTLLHSIGPAIYFVQAVYYCGIAGVFSCSIIHLCEDVPTERRAEVLGTLGTSGFLGMILGPQIGDWLFRGGDPTRHEFTVMFATSAVLNFGYLLFVAYMTRRTTAPHPHEPPPLGRLLVDYWPGTIVVVAMMMGLAQVVSARFLTLLQKERGLAGVGVFFWFYSPTAIVMRLAGRRWPEKLGRRKAAIIGLVCVAVSLLLYVRVTSEWDLVWPALLAGTGHALLFPSVTTLGADAFPERYRATGTTLILGFIDVGSLCGAPALGWIIDHYGFAAMFESAGAVVALVAVLFSIRSWLRARSADAARDAESDLRDDAVPMIGE